MFMLAAMYHTALRMAAFYPHPHLYPNDTTPDNIRSRVMGFGFSFTSSALLIIIIAIGLNLIAGRFGLSFPENVGPLVSIRVIVYTIFVLCSIYLVSFKGETILANRMVHSDLVDPIEST